MDGHRPRTSPSDNLAWRALCALPLIGPAVWASNERHSLSRAPIPSSPFPPRYFQSPTSGLLVHHRTWQPPSSAPPPPPLSARTSSSHGGLSHRS